MAVAGAAFVAAGLWGCSGGDRREAEVRRAVASGPRLDVVGDRELVIPIREYAAIDLEEPPMVRIDDGRAVPAELRWISAEADRSGATWLPSPERWRSRPATEDAAPPPGAWLAMIVDLPPDAIGQGLWIDRVRVPLNWVPEPPAVVESDRAKLLEQFAAEAAPDWSISQHLEGLLAPERSSPLRRWRYRLLTGTLWTGEGEPFADAAVEALARQMDARWRIGLLRLRRADLALARRVEWRLTALVDFGGVLAPAWPLDGTRLDMLLGDLLDPRISEVERALRARQWLDEEPPARAWVIDDAGVPDGAGGSIAMCGVANLTGQAALAWAAPASSPTTPDLATLRPFRALHLPVLRGPSAVPARGGAARARPAPTEVRVRAGRWEERLPVVLDALPLTPPGLTVGPLLADWTLPGWLEGVPAVGEGAPWPTAALLHRASDGSGWVLYVECAAPGGVQGSVPESVRVWLGPFRRPYAVLRIGADGVVMDEMAGGSAEAPHGVVVTREPGRWTAHVPIPGRCIEADGTLRLGIERFDARGQRSAWPRPMLPWQTEPGRVAVDTTAWGELGAPEAPRLPR